VSLARPFDNYIVEVLWKMQLEQHAAAAAAAATSMHPNSAKKWIEYKNSQLVKLCSQ